MQPFRLTLKNYRCFEDSHPLVIEVRPGLTALIGPNNAGKSTLLKFFYEFRGLFPILADASNWVSFARGETRQVHPAGALDALEVFHDGNERPLQVAVELLDVDGGVGKAVLTCARDARMVWSVELYSGDGRQRLTEVVRAGADEVTFKSTDGSSLAMSLAPWKELADWAVRILYIGPHRSAIGQSSGAYYDLAIGSSFINTWTQWKTGPSRLQSQAVLRACDEIARIFGYRQIEINAASNNDLQIIVDGRPFFLRELGAGLAQFIVVLGNVMVKRPSMLLLDEPEIHLHPKLQAEFLLTLAERATDGVIYATHSLGLARTTAHPIYSFQRQGRKSIVTPFEQTIDLGQFLGELSFSAYRELGCNTLLLVEGINEVNACHSILRMFGKDHDVAVLPVGGDQFFGASRNLELSELTRFAPNVAILIDSERSTEAADLPPLRQDFVRRSTSLGFKIHATERRAFENYLTDSAIKTTFGNEQTALGPYESIKNRTRSWSKADNWKVLRNMTREDLADTDLGSFFESL